MKTKSISTPIKLVALGGCFLLLTSCGLFKKKCDCPTWSKQQTEQPTEHKA